MPACRLAAYWGKWFARIGDGDMKQTNLNIFLRFGGALQQLQDRIEIGMRGVDFFVYLFLAQEWMLGFITQTDECASSLSDSRSAAKNLLRIIREMMASVQNNSNHLVTQEEVTALIGVTDLFERDFEREHRNLCVFMVTPKGLYDTRLLIEKGEEKFLDSTRSVFNPQVIYDLQQSGKCLAFEIPTAMAFHVMRATESLIKDYYAALVGKAWPYAQRDWGKYLTELEKIPDVNKVITSRLGEIKNLNRNPLIHPEEIVPLAEAPIIYDLCNGVIYYMAEEIRKRRP